MQLKLDPEKIYAVALEGGGAKGGYEIGVWQALSAAGIRYNAVSGTSVGALNGALYAMGDLQRAVDAWSDLRLGDVVRLGEGDGDRMAKLLSGGADLAHIESLLPQIRSIVQDRGLDVAPLRSWVHELVDPHAIVTGDVDLFVTTVCITDRKAMEVHVNTLSEDSVCDMLLASAYHPSFRLEPLGGKLYADGGFFDSLPLHALITHGCRDIIAVHMPGIGIQRHVTVPDGVHIYDIWPSQDLGGALNFSADQARRDMRIGYYDAVRMLYGLGGRRFCIERTLTDREALTELLNYYHAADPAQSLRTVCEHTLPGLAHTLGVKGGDYWELYAALLEAKAEKAGMDPLQVRMDVQLRETVG